MEFKEPTDAFISHYFHPSLLAAKAYHIDTPKVAVKLDQNEVPWDWSPELKSRIMKRLDAIAWNGYMSAFSAEITDLIAE